MRTFLKRNSKIITFLGITFWLTVLTQLPVVWTGSIYAGGGALILAAMWSPGIAAMVTQLIFQKNLRHFGWCWGKTRFQFLSYIIPLTIIALVYGIVWLSGLGVLSTDGYALKVSKEFGIEPPLPFVLSVLVIATLGLAVNSIAALGEEIGWRGFLVPELAKKLTFKSTAIVSGLIWAVWHYPIIIWADYSKDIPAWFALPIVTVMFVGMSTVMAWIRLKSGSLWGAVIFHASHNLFIQAVFGQLTIKNEYTNYFASEFGFLSAIGYGCLAVYIYYVYRNKPVHNKTE